VPTTDALRRSSGSNDIEVLRSEVGAWVEANWSHDITVREWWRRLAAARLSAPTWPEPYGRGLSGSQARVVTEELAAARVVAPPQGTVGTTLAGPTLLEHGTHDQRERYLPPLLRGEESWCQLFSEPGAGSDLASLGTKAELDGDRWVVTGQKVWNSGADIARRGMLLARTDPDVPKQAGISYFVIDMDQPTIEARPLRQMNGEAHFCEVFLTGAVVGREDVVEGLGQGWRVARSTLAYERAAVAGRPPRGLVSLPSGEPAGYLDRVVGDVLEAGRERRKGFTGNAVPFRHLADIARERDRNRDAHIRQLLAHYHSLVEINRFTQLRARAAAQQGRSPGPEGSITKLAVSHICRTSREVSFALMGPATMLGGADAPDGGSLHTVALGSFGTSIGGGTDEIQRNLLAERVLGLPRERQLDREVAFRELPLTSTTID
jgi:alkylation response protein AidB-like acyl-CoA dehydrogenase